MSAEDWRPVLRGYLELAEAVHPGPMRDYHALLVEYLASVAQLVGTDEHVCHVCGRPNYPRTMMFWGWGSVFFCDEHRAEFVVYSETHPT